jgi:cardiolipin synthase (CMP-forming)
VDLFTQHLKKIFPTALSSLRLLISFALPFLPQSSWLWCVLIAAVSDFADGWFARRWKMESRVGGIVDAVADKVFAVVILWVLASAGNFSPFWIPFILARDFVVAFTTLLVLVHRSWSLFKDAKVRPSGKIATGGQFLLFIIILVYPPSVLPALIFTSIFSLCAALDYSYAIHRALLLHENSGQQ